MAHLQIGRFEAMWDTEGYERVSLSNPIFFSPVFRAGAGGEQAARAFPGAVGGHPEHLPLGAGPGGAATRPPLHLHPAVKQEQAG